MTVENHPAGLAETSEDLSREGIEDEDTGAGSAAVKPWDPKKIRITTKNFTLREVADQINDKDIDLAPDFQRDFVWKQRQRTRLVESILLGIPLPAFYFNQDRDGTYQVVDGVQRLSTIRLFMSDRHVLKADDLEYLRDLQDLKYSEMEPAMMRRFRSTQIVVHVIEPQTPDEIKYDIFGRVNTLGSPLSAQEIRHAMSKVRSREFLHSLVHLQSFDEATQWSFWKKPSDATSERVRDSKRMADRELALRFCAFSSFSEDDYRHYESLDAFLVEFTRRIDDRSDRGVMVSDQELDTLHRSFDQAMQNAAQVLGNAAFRRWPPGREQRRGPLNRAVFESQAIALASYPLSRLLPKQHKIVAAFRATFKDEDYTRAVTVGTGDPAKVSLRLNRTREILTQVVG